MNIGNDDIIAFFSIMSLTNIIICITSVFTLINTSTLIEDVKKIKKFIKL